jgi:predicted Zn-dependent protease
LLETLPPDDPESALLFASLSRSIHDSNDVTARAEIDRRFLLASKAHPENAALAREACDHFRNSGRKDEAIGILQRHVEAAPWSLDARVRLGILQFAANRDADGEKTLKEVLDIHPKQALAHQALAKFYRLHDQPEPAAFHAAELLKIRGGSPDEFLKLADERMAADHPREARLLLEKAVFDHPENPALRMKLAIAAHRDPETRASSSCLFREAETAAPDGKITDPAFLTESAGALIEAGQSKAAEERLRAAIRAYPTDAKKETAAALRRLAELWQTENRNAEAARALLQRADSLDPK